MLFQFKGCGLHPQTLIHHKGAVRFAAAAAAKCLLMVICQGNLCGASCNLGLYIMLCYAPNKHKGMSYTKAEDCIDRIFTKLALGSELVSAAAQGYLPRTRDQKLTADESSLQHSSALQALQRGLLWAILRGNTLLMAAAEDALCD
jgi:hypothetical protein